MIFLIKLSSRGIVGQVDSNHFRKTEPVIWLFCTFSKSKGPKFWVAGKKPRLVLLWNKWLIVSLIFTPLVHHSTLILSSVIARSRLNPESRAASTAPSWRDSQFKKKKKKIHKKKSAKRRSGTSLADYTWCSNILGGFNLVCLIVADVSLDCRWAWWRKFPLNRMVPCFPATKLFGAR